MEVPAFQAIVWGYYRLHGRHELPWRQFEPDGTLDPYKVLVSEVMLQQTQVPRVIPRFDAFIRQFPDVHSLAAAPLSDVLKAWNGLGYNRRAKFLWQAARTIVSDFGGRVPEVTGDLVKLPGIGHNTAGAIAAYAYNKPVVFIETNIRTVFIYHFFADEQQVADKAIANLVAQTLPDGEGGRAAGTRIHFASRAIRDPQEPQSGVWSEVRNPVEVSHIRNWYWALMDYGTHLKQAVGNVNKQSKHYSRQPAFEGSRRQIRGQVLKFLAAKPHSVSNLAQLIADVRLPEVLQDLEREGLIAQIGLQYTLADGHTESAASGKGRAGKVRTSIIGQSMVQ
jgi:A/G-specific adenine glycosylase